MLYREKKLQYFLLVHDKNDKLKKKEREKKWLVLS
jgi:hypothetical protein